MSLIEGRQPGTRLSLGGAGQLQTLRPMVPRSFFGGIRAGSSLQGIVAPFVSRQAIAKLPTNTATRSRVNRIPIRDFTSRSDDAQSSSVFPTSMTSSKSPCCEAVRPANEAFPRPRVVGIEDLARRKGRRCGILVCDLERRAVTNLLRLWELSDDEACDLLGGMSVRTWSRWKAGDIGRIDRDLGTRLSLFLGIHKALR